MADFPRTWVVVADSARARIFQWPNRNEDLVELVDLTNSLARLPEQALTSDRPGQAFGSHSHGRRRMQTTKSESENAIDDFARDLAAELKNGLENSRYERFVLIAPPRFLGKVRMALTGEVGKRLIETVALNLTKESISAIRSHLPQLSTLGD